MYISKTVHVAPNVGGQRAQEKAAANAARVAGYKVDGVCARCYDIVVSKKANGKYRPLRQPAKCAGCHQKAVFSAYYTYCNACSNSRRICSRCGDKRGEYQGSKETDDQIRSLAALLEEGGLNERQRRSTLRKLEKAKEERRGNAKAVREGRVQAAPASALDSDSGNDSADEEEAPHNNYYKNNWIAPSMEEFVDIANSSEDSEEEEILSTAFFTANKINKAAEVAKKARAEAKAFINPANLEFTPGTGMSFDFGSTPAAPMPPTATAPSARSASSVPEAKPAAPAAAGTAAPGPSLIPFRDAASVDGAFASTWAALIDVTGSEQAAAAEASFDDLIAALPEAEADRITDALAEALAAAPGGSGSDAPTEAATALVTLREVLRWRATHGATGEAAAVTAAEGAAKVLFQLLTMSRSWSALNRWVGGKRAGI